MARARPGSEDFRGPILEYLSQEINSHASMIVGLAVVLFAYLDIIVRHFFEPPASFSLTFQASWETLQYILAFAVLVVIVWGLVYTLFRLSLFGVLTSLVLYYSKSNVQFSTMWQDMIGPEILGKAKLFAGFPAIWFTCRKGWIVSFFLSLVTCTVLAFILFWKL